MNWLLNLVDEVHVFVGKWLKMAKILNLICNFWLEGGSLMLKVEMILKNHEKVWLIGPVVVFIIGVLNFDELTVYFHEAIAWNWLE